MSTITAILEPDPDGTLHLPLPPELRGGKVRVEAKVEAVAAPEQAAGAVLRALGESETVAVKPAESRAVPHATPEMIARRIKAMEELRAMGGLKDVIPDPVAWQREIREDHPHPLDK